MLNVLELKQLKVALSTMGGVAYNGERFIRVSDVAALLEAFTDSIEEKNAALDMKEVSEE